MIVWLDGRVVDAERATVAIDDHGLVVGDGAFETLVVVRGRPFAATRHLRRLRQTLDALSIPAPATELLESALDQATEALGLDSGRLRLTVTGGRGSVGTGAPSGPPTVIVHAGELRPTGSPYAITVPWTRNERSAVAGLKTTSYAENVRALNAAHAVGASEAIFANTVGNLCEGTGTNVFVVIDGETVTPPLSSGCLAGVTRELVLELGGIVERDLPLDVLERADEIFLTSTTRDIQALTRVDDRELEAGPRAAELSAAFAGLVADTLDP